MFLADTHRFVHEISAKRNEKALAFAKALCLGLLLVGPTNEDDFGGIATAFAKLERTGVSAIAGRHAGTDDLEEGLEGFFGAEGLHRKTAGVEVVALGQGKFVKFKQPSYDRATPNNYGVGTQAGRRHKWLCLPCRR